MNARVTFPGGARVDAEYEGFTIRTDQPTHAGGGGTAPAPFDYFIASIATCAGFYVRSFLEGRGLSTRGVELTVETEREDGAKKLSRITVRVELPPEIPAKYERALVRAVDQCTVKRQILEPPEFRTTIRFKDAGPTEEKRPEVACA